MNLQLATILENTTSESEVKKVKLMEDDLFMQFWWLLG